MTDARIVGLSDGGTRTALVRRAQAGDPEAFDQLIRPTLNRHVRFAMALLHDEMDAHDVVQEAYVRAWRKLSRLHEAASFDSWMNQILVNTARSHLRTRRRIKIREIRVSDGGQLSPTHVHDRTPDDAVADRDLIRRAFDRLDADKRLILAAHYVDGLSVVAIAELFGIPEGTAKWRLHAARAALERGLEAEER